MEDLIDRIVDKDYLRDSMTFAAFFITVYESMTNYVVTNIHDFLCEEEFKEGEWIYHETPKYKEQIVNRIVDDKGNKDKTKASFLWFVDVDAITRDEYNLYLRAKNKRNIFAHQLFTVIQNGVSSDDIDLFVDMLSLYRKISNWWIIQVEIPIADIDIEDANLDLACGLHNMFFDIIVETLYNGKSEEYQKIVKESRNGGNV